MDIGDVLIWEATNGLLLIPSVIGLVVLVRWIRGRPVFTERDWLFLFGHSRKEVLSPRLLLTFTGGFVADDARWPKDLFLCLTLRSGWLQER